MKKDSAYWKAILKLEKHPEGGFYKEVYRSDEMINNYSLPDRYEGNRCFSTSIYFLLEKSDFSAFHKIKSDEIWHFYQGNSVILYIIDNNGNMLLEKLGNNPDNGEKLQITISKNSWFAAHINNKKSFSLVGCTVSPGFDFNDFIIGKRSDLINKFPQHKEIITLLSLSE